MIRAAGAEPAAARAARRRVLFVDDEQFVLDGLQNLLRKQRREWEMVFALGGEAALVELGKGAFDVVVSDMRMPGMDGAVLLQRVKDLHPTASRIVLSGHAEREAVLRALPVAHQFLSKPCDADTLRAVIERACAVGALLRDESIRRVVGKLDRLPSVPATYWKLTRAMAEPGASAAKVAEIVQTDPGMGIKVLQLVNSAYFGLAHRITSIQEAVRYLGMELLKGLALSAHVFTMMEQAPVEGFSLEQLQRHSLLTARIARRFAGRVGPADDAFAAGLVHDVGKIIVALAIPDRFREIARTARASGRAFHAVEKEVLGVTHAEIGAYLLAVWGLPVPIVEAVAFHHTPSVVTLGARPLLAVIHVADALGREQAEEEGAEEAGDSLDLAFLESEGLTGRLPEWRKVAEEEIRSQESCRT